MAICSLVCATLRHMSIGRRVVLAVTFQEVDAAPHAQAAAQGDDQSLQNVDSVSKKTHIHISFRSVELLGLKVGGFQFVQIERLVRLHDGRSAFHVPFNVKGVFLIGVGKVLVAGMFRYIKLVAEKRPHPSKLQDALASVHHRDLVLGHQLFTTMSSDEFKKGQKSPLLI